VAGRRLKAAAAALAQNNSDAFYTEIASALRGFFGDMLNREPHGLTMDDLDHLLGERGISEEERKSVRDLLDQSDAVRYSPASHSPAEMRGHYDRAFQIIQDFRKKL